MTTITQAINGTLTLITVGREIYEAVTELMDSVDKSEASGKSKKSMGNGCDKAPNFRGR